MADYMITSLDNIDINNIKIENQTIEQVRRQLLVNDITSEGLAKISYQNLNIIQLTALEYLQNMTKLVEDMQQLMVNMILRREAALRVKTGEKNSSFDFIQIGRKTAVQQQQFQDASYFAVLLQEKFIEELNIFLGLKYSAAYTPYLQGKKIPSLDIYQLDSLQHILRIPKETGNAYLKQSKTYLEGLISSGVRGIKKINKTDYLSENQAKNLQIVYSGFLTRYEQNVYKHTPPHLVLFNLDSKQPSSIWGKMWFQNTGGIVEAYQRIVFQRKEIFKNETTPPEYDFLRFAFQIQQSDSTPGFLEQDTETKFQSIASKGGSASIPGFQASIKFAKDILNLSLSEIQSRIKFYLQHYKKSLHKDDGATRYPLEIVGKQSLKEITKGLINK